MNKAVTPANGIFSPADVLDASIMGREETMYALFDHLRSTDPVAWVEHPEYRPFWALTRYDDVKSIGSANDDFLSAPRTVLVPEEAEKMFLETFGTPNGLETLIHMDRPKHLKLRKVTREWFLPRSIDKLTAEIQDLAKEYVDKMVEMGSECDFVKDVALYFPLRIILSILGLPRESEETMLKLTQEIFGGQDPDLQRGEDLTAGMQVLHDFGAYFNEVIADRKVNPRDDLATVLANAEVDGDPMDPLDQMSYFIITASAVHASREDRIPAAATRRSDRKARQARVVRAGCGLPGPLQDRRRQGNHSLGVTRTSHGAHRHPGPGTARQTD